MREKSGVVYVQKIRREETKRELWFLKMVKRNLVGDVYYRRRSKKFFFASSRSRERGKRKNYGYS